MRASQQDAGECIPPSALFLEKTMTKRFFSNPAKLVLALFAATAVALPSLAMAEKAYLEITLKVDPRDRPAAGEIYAKYKQPFLDQIPGATSKELLMRDVLTGLYNRIVQGQEIDSGTVDAIIAMSNEPTLEEPASPEAP